MFSTLTNTVMLGNPKRMSGPNGQITRIVIHGTVSPLVPGGARAVARYFQSQTAGGLAHYVVDMDEIVGCCPEETKCAHAPPNAGSIGIELCDPQTGDPARWDDDDHRKMLALAASLTRDLCQRYSLPMVWRDAGQLRAGNHGITGHVQVAEAFHLSDHTDPRDMPVDTFMALVTQQPQPSPPPIIGDFPMEFIAHPDGEAAEFHVNTTSGYLAAFDDVPSRNNVQIAATPPLPIVKVSAKTWVNIQNALAKVRG